MDISVFGIYATVWIPNQQVDEQVSKHPTKIKSMSHLSNELQMHINVEMQFAPNNFEAKWTEKFDPDTNLQSL